MQIKNRQQFLVVLTIAAAALFVGVNFIYAPLSGWWSTRAAEIKDLRDRVHDGKMLIRREPSVRSLWDDMQTNALPANLSLAEQQLLRSFDGWARDSGAEITDITPQWKSDATNYMTLDCRVEATGDLGMLSRFIYSMENSPTALRVDSVELGAHDNTGQQLTLGLEMDGLALTHAQ
ncbi:MAG: hypothetical protein ABSE48_18175 [Verrucomicrobiota bacterium]